MFMLKVPLKGRRQLSVYCLTEQEECTGQLAMVLGTLVPSLPAARPQIGPVVTATITIS